MVTLTSREHRCEFDNVSECVPTDRTVTVHSVAVHDPSVIVKSLPPTTPYVTLPVPPAQVALEMEVLVICTLALTVEDVATFAGFVQGVGEHPPALAVTLCVTDPTNTSAAVAVY